MLKLGHILPIWYDMLLKVQHINKLCVSLKTKQNEKNTYHLDIIFGDKTICPRPKY